MTFPRPSTLSVLCVLLLLPGAVASQQFVSAPSDPVPAEFSSRFDKQAAAGVGGIGAHDPSQVLYAEPPDLDSDSFPSDALDFAPAEEVGVEPDLQVDALANGDDALFDSVMANTSELFVSLAGDPIPLGPQGIAVYREDPAGTTEPVYGKHHFFSANTLGALDDVDALELWGPVGGNDARFFSWRADVR